MANTDQKDGSNLDPNEEQLLDRILEGITISGSFNIVVIQVGSRSASISPQLTVRVEGGGQVNNEVGAAATQGGQNAIDRSLATNDHSDFANGNGRSGIAGDENDEQGGQQAAKVRDSRVKRSIITTGAAQSQVEESPAEELGAES
jgi:hypothetical protein